MDRITAGIIADHYLQHVGQAESLFKKFSLNYIWFLNMAPTET
jgi:hypothetical protein